MRSHTYIHIASFLARLVPYTDTQYNMLFPPTVRCRLNLNKLSILHLHLLTMLRKISERISLLPQSPPPSPTYSCVHMTFRYVHFVRHENIIICKTMEHVCERERRIKLNSPVKWTGNNAATSWWEWGPNTDINSASTNEWVGVEENVSVASDSAHPLRFRFVTSLGSDQRTQTFLPSNE